MILRSPDGVGYRSIDGASALTDARVQEAIFLRRCAMHRKAFRGTEVGYPADALRFGAVAGWIRREDVTVDIADADELDWAVVSGIDPSHIVMHGVDERSGSIAVDYGVGRYIVDSVDQVAILGSRFGHGGRSVLVDASGECLDELVVAVTADRRLELVGLHCRADGSEVTELAQIIFAMISEMACIRRGRRVLLSRLSVSDVDLTQHGVDPRSMRLVAELIHEAVEESCVRFRYPRPGLTMSPSTSTLLPAA